MTRLVSFATSSVLLFLLLSGCTASKTITETQHHLRNVPDYRAVSLDSASTLLEGYRGDDEEEVLYRLEHAALNHYRNNWDESTRHFQLAERAIDRNYTKSINRNLQAMLVNDLQLAYPGEPYEDIYLTTFNCLNFLHLGDIQGALVEVRRVTNKLEVLNDRYRGLAESLSRRDTAQAAVRKVNDELDDVDLLDGTDEERAPELQQNSAFARFLTTVLYAKSGSPNDARIERTQLRAGLEDQGNAEFLSAFSTSHASPSYWEYVFPTFWAEDRDVQENESLLSSLFGPMETASRDDGGGTASAEVESASEVTIPAYDDLTRSDAYNVLLVAFSGKPPEKKEQSYQFNILIDGEEVQLNFAVPVLDMPGTRVARTRAIVAGDTLDVPLVEDMQSVAQTMFEKKKPIIYTRAVIRSFLKAGATEGAEELAEEEAGGTAGWLTEQVGEAMSRRAAQADTRGWQTMPGFAYATVAALPSGSHDVRFEYLSEEGDVLKVRTHQLTVDGAQDFALAESIYLE